MDLWSELPRLSFRSEGDVESHLVLPLLQALDYPHDHIASKYPVTFHKGTKGRPHEADYVVFCSNQHDRNTSLAVFEAKSPKNKLENAGHQAESYANWLRAPFYVLTNGLHLEVWQMQLSRESSLVFDAKVADLAGRREELEALLHREALIAHCDALRIKELRIDSIDPMPFLDATLAETTGDFIDTRTFRRLDGEQLQISVEGFDRDLPSGVMVTGGPGSGKTTFAQVLERYIARATAMGDSQLLPVYVYLPDVVESEASILKYSRARISAHLPAICTPDAFKGSLLRPGKIVFLCDALDRVVPTNRTAIDASLRNLRRDFPRCRLVVFGQRPATEQLNLETELELLPLSYAEMVEAFATITHCAHDEARATLSTMPTVSRGLFSTPLFWTEAIRHRGVHGDWPRDLAGALESWLGRISSTGNASPTTVARREQALAAIASIPELTITSVVSTLDAEGFEASMVDGLIGCGALRERRSTLEFCHELLAAYLRVRWALQQPRTRLPTVMASGGTAETTLLSSIMRGHPDERLLWDNVLARGLTRYVEAVVARKPTVETSTVSINDCDVHPLLAEVRDGLLEPVHGCLSDLAESIFCEIGAGDAWPSQSSLGIRGDVDFERGSMYYRYTDDGVVKRELAGTRGRPLPRRIFSLSLNHFRLHLGGGRLLGMRDLRDALRRIVGNGALPGGPIWCRERLIGAADYLRWLGAEIPFHWRLSQFSEWLKENEDVVYWGRYPGERDIPLWTLTPLVELGLEAGDVGLAFSGLPEPDREPPAGETAWSIWSQYSRDAMLVVAGELKRREVLAYKEVVEASFPNIAHDMMYAQMPARYELYLNASEDRPWVAERWFPVRTWDDVDIDVQVGTAVPELGLRDEFERLERELASLNRPTHSISGDRSEGLSVSGMKRGLTPVMERVISAIDNDLRNVFRAID